jgi:hypothetical protein
MCVTKESMDSATICEKLKWYCDNSLAQSNVLDMSGTVCKDNNWGTRACCYAEDNGAGCNREALLMVSFHKKVVRQVEDND